MGVDVPYIYFMTRSALSSPPMDRTGGSSMVASVSVTSTGDGGGCASV